MYTTRQDISDAVFGSCSEGNGFKVYFILQCITVAAPAVKVPLLDGINWKNGCHCYFQSNVFTKEPSLFSNAQRNCNSYFIYFKPFIIQRYQYLRIIDYIHNL